MRSIYFSSWLAFVLRRGEAAVLVVTVRKAELKQRKGRAEALGTSSQLEGSKLEGGWEHFCCCREKRGGWQHQCAAKRLSGKTGARGAGPVSCPAGVSGTGRCAAPTAEAAVGGGVSGV